MSLNRWVFKWRLKVRMFSHSRISAGRVPGGWSSNRESATGSSVCMRGTTSSGASDERRARGGACKLWICIAYGREHASNALGLPLPASRR